MAETILLRYGSGGPELLDWAIVAAPGRVSESGTAAIADVAAKCGRRRIVLLVPGTEVLLTRALVPTRNVRQMQLAAPFAVEDELAGELETLHVASGDRDEKGAVALGVVNRGRMDEWLEPLVAAGIEPEVVTSEVLALPYDAGSWAVLVEGGQVLVRDGRQSGFVLEADAARVVITKRLTEAEDGASVRLQVWRPKEGTPVEATGWALDNHPTVEGLIDRPLIEWLATGARLGDFLNLRQGPYLPQGKSGENLWMWWAAAVLSFFAVLVYGGGSVTEYLQMQEEGRVTEARVEELFRTAFPEVRRIVNPRVQMEQRLAELERGRGSGEGSSGFLDLLFQVGQRVSEEPGLTLQGLVYRGQGLDLTLLATELSLLEDFKSHMIASGNLQAVIMAAVASGSGVEGRLRIEREAP